MTAINPATPTQPAPAGPPPAPASSGQAQREVERAETARPVTAPESSERSNVQDRDRSAGRSEESSFVREARSERSSESDRQASENEARAAQNDRTVAEQRAETRSDRSERGQTVDLFA